MATSIMIRSTRIAAQKPVLVFCHHKAIICPTTLTLVTQTGRYIRDLHVCQHIFVLRYQSKTAQSSYPKEKVLRAICLSDKHAMASYDRQKSLDSAFPSSPFNGPSYMLSAAVPTSETRRERREREKPQAVRLIGVRVPDEQSGRGCIGQKWHWVQVPYKRPTLAGVGPRNSFPGDEIAPMCMQYLHSRQCGQRQKEQLLY